MKQMRVLIIFITLPSLQIMGARVIFVPNDDYCDQGGGGAERSGVGCNCLVLGDSCCRGEASQQAHSEDDVVAGLSDVH